MNIFLKTVAVFIYIIFISTGQLISQVMNAGDSVCVQVIGIALMDEHPIDGVDVTLYQENEEMEMTEITSVSYHEHRFLFSLKRDQYYTIKVAKEGYVTRMVAISTKLPKAVDLNPVFVYEFELEMFKEKKDVNNYYLDFPIGLIDYDAKEDAFVSRDKYTKHIKAKINEALNPTPLDSIKLNSIKR